MSRKFQWCLKGVSSFQDGSRKFQECFKRVSRVFKKVLGGFIGRLKGVSR